MKESLAWKLPPNSCQHSYVISIWPNVMLLLLNSTWAMTELTKPSKIMWTYRIRSFHKWFSRLGPPSLLLLHLHELPKWALGVFRAKISGTFTATTLLMPQKPLGGLSPLPNFGASTDGLRLWAFWGLGEALHFHDIFCCFLFLALACLPNWIGPCCFLKPTLVPIPFILHLYPNLHIYIYI